VGIRYRRELRILRAIEQTLLDTYTGARLQERQYSGKREQRGDRHRDAGNED